MRGLPGGEADFAQRCRGSDHKAAKRRVLSKPGRAGARRNGARTPERSPDAGAGRLGARPQESTRPPAFGGPVGVGYEACVAGSAHSVARPGSEMVSWIGALSTFVGREQDAHKREEREEGDGAGDQHVEVLLMIWIGSAGAGLPALVAAIPSICFAHCSLTNLGCKAH